MNNQECDALPRIPFSWVAAQTAVNFACISSVKIIGILQQVAALLILYFALAPTTGATENVELMRIPSGIASLNLFMRHMTAPVPNAGPPILILHGATFPSANAAAWRIDGHSWMDDLAEHGYEVYALDFLGYGESDRYPEMLAGAVTGPPLGDVASMVVQVERAVSAIISKQPGTRIAVIAHSAGTFAAARYAELHPDRVARLVLFGAPVPSDGAQVGQMGEALSARFLQVSAQDQLEAFESRVRETGRLDSHMFAAWAAVYLASDPESNTRQPASVRVPAGMSAAVVEMRRRGTLPYDPARIMTPTLVIQGEWDAVVPPSQGLWLFEHLASPFKRFVVLSQGGHRIHLERGRSELYHEVLAFLAARSATGESVR
jgi:pimeloyl-ACP methyl ester carboxylesterase